VTDVFTFQELLDAHELLDLREANEKIARDWAAKK
jgi:hypothetical protein